MHCNMNCLQDFRLGCLMRWMVRPQLNLHLLEVMMVAYGRHREDTVVDSQDSNESYKLYGSAGNCFSSPGAPTIPSIATYISNSSSLITRTMDDMVTPDFHKIVASGGIVNSPMSSVYSETTVPALSFDFNSSWDAWTCTPLRWCPFYLYRQHGKRSMSTIPNSAPLALPSLDVDMETVMDRAITSAWANIGSEEVLALSAAAEMNSTVQGLSYMLKKVYKITKAVKRRELQALKRELSWKELQEIYMNARYNLRPIAYDVKGCMAIIEKGVAKPQRQTFRGKSSESEITSEQINVLFEKQNTLEFRLDIQKVSSRSITARAGVLCEADQQSYANSFGVDKIIETVWDLTPYSFIVDWFANVGDTISSWVPVIGFKPLTSWVTVEILDSQLSTIIGGSAPPYADYAAYRMTNQGTSLIPCTWSIINRTRYRVPNYQRPVLPTCRLNIDPLKLLDLAIIGKNIRKNKPRT